MEGEEKEECHGLAIPATPAIEVRPEAISLIETPKSKYALRVRSSTARYVPLEEEETNNETMSSDESDSGLEKNYLTMTGDDEDTMEETVDEEKERDERSQSSLSRVASNEKRTRTTTKMTNTCTESSVAFGDIYDTGIETREEREEEGGRKRERESVHDKAFRWEGAEPPQLTAEQVELIREFKEGGRCSLCPRKQGYRGVSRMERVEQSMMAHLIINHAKNEDAMAIVTRKRFLLATSLSSSEGVVMVPPFLLQSLHPHHLTCSRCMEFKCAKQSNLVIHWATCIGVRGNRWRTVNRRGGKEEGEGKITPKRVMNSVRCPLCREGWRKSTHYSDDVSVAIHLMMKHTTEEEAYKMACQLEEETDLQSSFPFIHLTDSFSLRVEHPDSGIQCARCDVNSPSLATAIRHATRYHAKASEREEAGFTPGALPCPLASTTSCSMKLRSILVGRPRSIIALNFIHVLFNHRRRDSAAARFMREITPEEKEKLRTETNMRLDVDQCLKWWREGTPRLVCSLCSTASVQVCLHARHFEEQRCGEEGDRIRGDRAGERNASTIPTKKPLPSTPRTPDVVKTPEKRGRGRAPEAAMDCAHCERVIYASSQYAPSVSMDIHLMKMHPKEKTITSLSTFPFIDFSLSSADSLQCSLCDYTTSQSRYVIPHAWTKHPEESREAQGMAAWAEFEMSVQRKRLKQRVSCSRSAKRMRKEMRESGGEMEDEEREEEGEGVKRRKVDEEEGEGPAVATATAYIRTPRQRSTVSRWLDTALAGTSTYSPATTTRVDEDLRDRLDRLFGVTNPASAPPSKPAHASSSIFSELTGSAMSRMAPKGRAEDVSHIKGVEGVRCSVCTFKGRDTESLRIHFNEAHQEVSALSVPDVFPCAACSLVFNSKKKWRCHCEEDHTSKDRPFQCFRCEYRYETHPKLRAHQIRVHESEILVHPDDRTCIKCNKLFGSLRAYQNHKKRHEAMEKDEERYEDSPSEDDSDGQ
ncbi:hypothetical protein PENTCL1PPCAC_10871 [Pristionchus entomophagus]|uniref:C2H2-type domain-containing protein n=1 Tax=Pristionchus entomophagus TaxID=358040 RepID=A0AAV5SZP3_9BILA|nr:hypothetical protein PENTCL1PPCAC_10871 [Pristionchus entomophagus]